MQILALGTGRETSADFTLAAVTAVYLTAGGTVDPGARVSIAAKDAAGDYTHQATLTGSYPGGELPAGTYQATRTHGTCGVEYN